MNETYHKISKNDKSVGFTLIELLVVFSIIAVLSTTGIAAFVNYSRHQALTTGTAEMATVFQQARSRALSQVKPQAPTSTCAGTLDGYKVGLCKLSNGLDCLQSEREKDYALYAICGGVLSSPALDSRTLPKNILITSAPVTAFTFRVISGIVEGGSPSGTSIVITGYGRTKTLKLYANGKIEVQ